HLLDSVHIHPVDEANLRIPAEEPMVAVQAIPGQIVTRKIEVQPKVKDGVVVADTEQDLLKLATVERHHATGNVGVGLINGFGLKRGALATSIAHDAHNIVCIGTNDEDMLLAISTVAEMGGGLVAVDDGTVLRRLPLPVAGILSDQPL